MNASSYAMAVEVKLMMKIRLSTSSRKQRNKFDTASVKRRNIKT